MSGGLALVRVEPVQSAAKHGLTLAEVVEAYGGGPGLVRELREIGALRPAAEGRQKLLFDASQVAETWARFTRGEFNRQLENWRGVA